jgi:hypothetical protein
MDNMNPIFIVPALALLAATTIIVPQAYAHSDHYNQGYAAGISEWDHWNSDALVNTPHTFECPLIHTDPGSDYCKGYDAALKFSTSDG